MEDTPKVSLIAAMDCEGVIGRDNRLPWRLPADLRRFRQLTLDRPILMGRRTWESLPGLLPRRRHFVVTRDPNYCAPGCEIVHSPEAALITLAGIPEVLVIGGAQLYQAMLAHACRLYLTLIEASFTGDTHFPHWAPEEWLETAREVHPADAENPYPFTFLTLERLEPPAWGPNRPAGVRTPGQDH